MFRKQLLGAALIAAVAAPGLAGSAHAETGNPVESGFAAAATTRAQEGAIAEYAVAEYASVRTGDTAPAMLDMGIDGSAAASMTDGKQFSVFCISMVASLAVMLGVFGLMVRRKSRA